MSLRECWSDTSICSASQCRTIFRHMERTLLDFYSAREVHCACIAKANMAHPRAVIARCYMYVHVICAYANIHVCMYVCMYVYIYIYI